MPITNKSSSKSYKPSTPGCFAPSNEGWKSIHHSRPANIGQVEQDRALEMPLLLGDVGKGLPGAESPSRQRNVGDTFHPQGQRQTLKNTGLAYSSPSFLAQNGAFFCRKEEEFQRNPTGRGVPGNARGAVRWGPKSHTQHKCLATVWEKPGLGGRF